MFTCMAKSTSVKGIQNQEAALAYRLANSPALQVQSTSAPSVSVRVISVKGAGKLVRTRQTSVRLAAYTVR